MNKTTHTYPVNTTWTVTTAPASAGSGVMRACSCVVTSTIMATKRQAAPPRLTL